MQFPGMLCAFLILSATVSGRTHGGHGSDEPRRLPLHFENGIWKHANQEITVNCVDKADGLKITFPAFCKSSPGSPAFFGGGQECYSDEYAESAFKDMAKKVCKKEFMQKTVVCTATDVDGVSKTKYFNFYSQCHQSGKVKEAMDLDITIAQIQNDINSKARDLDAIEKTNDNVVALLAQNSYLLPVFLPLGIYWACVVIFRIRVLADLAAWISEHVGISEHGVRVTVRRYMMWYRLIIVLVYSVWVATNACIGGWKPIALQLIVVLFVAIVIEACTSVPTASWVLAILAQAAGGVWVHPFDLENVRNMASNLLKILNRQEEELWFDVPFFSAMWVVKYTVPDCDSEMKTLEDKLSELRNQRDADKSKKDEIIESVGN